MGHTFEPPAGAKGAGAACSLLLLTTLATGCNVDLSRENGSLDVHLLGVPVSADQIALQVDTGPSQYSATIDIAAFEGKLRVENIPVGARATLHAEARQAGALLVSRDLGVEVVAFTVVTLDLGEQGMVLPGVDAGVQDPGSTHSGPLPFRARGLRASLVSGGQLEVDIEGNDGSVFENFLTGARARLGGEPVAFALSSATLALEAGAEHVEDLADLWSALDVSIRARSGGGEVRVAGLATLPERSGPEALTVSGGRAALASVFPSLQTLDFRIRLEGATPRTPQDDFRADVRLTLDFIAYKE